MTWKNLLLAACLALAAFGCAVEDDDGDAPDINVTTEEQVMPAPDAPDVEVGVEERDTEIDVDAEAEAPAPDRGTDIDIDAEAESAPVPPENPDQTP